MLSASNDKPLSQELSSSHSNINKHSKRKGSSKGKSSRNDCLEVGSINLGIESTTSSSNSKQQHHRKKSYRKKHQHNKALTPERKSKRVHKEHDKRNKHVTFKAKFVDVINVESYKMYNLEYTELPNPNNIRTKEPTKCTCLII
jgi:hypothetical protein